MAVDLAAFPAKMDSDHHHHHHTAIQEAAAAGLQSMEHLIRLLSSKSQTPNFNHQINLDCSEITDFTVSKFKRVISLLNRTGHARFRRGPPSSVPPNPVLNSLDPSPNFNFPKPNSSAAAAAKLPLDSASPTESTTTSSLVSSVTGDGSVSNGKLGLSLFTTTAAVSCGKPPLSGKRKWEDGGAKNCSKPCHCKRGKSGMKKIVKVPAISSKIADIPSDEYSWRKYGQKPIKGSPYPRGYYRCSTVKGCPARKHVERSRDDPTMLRVTYDGDHHHPHPTLTKTHS